MCLSGCSSITKYVRIMRLAPFEKLNVTDSSSLWGDTPAGFGAMHGPLKFGIICKFNHQVEYVHAREHKASIYTR